MKYAAEKETVDRIENNFTYHKPVEGQADRYVLIRDTAKAFAHTLAANCPNSRERSVAMTKLEEVVFWANAAIARNEG